MRTKHERARAAERGMSESQITMTGDLEASEREREERETMRIIVLTVTPSSTPCTGTGQAWLGRVHRTSRRWTNAVRC